MRPGYFSNGYRADAGRQSSRGFSLLELIVVIAMMAALTGMIIPRINIGGSKDLVKTETQRLAELMRRASEEAVFKTRQIGMYFSDGDYRFLILEGDNRTGKWIDYADSKVFRTREYPEDVDVLLEISGVPVILEGVGKLEFDEKTRPHVMFLSNGEIMPDFRLTMEKGALEEGWQVGTGVETAIEFGAVEDS